MFECAVHYTCAPQTRVVAAKYTKIIKISVSLLWCTTLLGKKTFARISNWKLIAIALHNKNARSTQQRYALEKFAQYIL